MDIFKIIGVAILSAVAILCVRQTRQDVAVVLSIAAGLVILLMILNSLTTVITAFNDIAETTGIDSGLFSGVIKIIGVGYLTEFSADILEDGGLKNLSDKVIFAGKVLIMLMALPVLTEIISLIKELLI